MRWDETLEARYAGKDVRRDAWPAGRYMSNAFLLLPEEDRNADDWEVVEKKAAPEWAESREVLVEDVRPGMRIRVGTEWVPVMGVKVSGDYAHPITTEVTLSTVCGDIWRGPSGWRIPIQEGTRSADGQEAEAQAQGVKRPQAETCSGCGGTGFDLLGWYGPGSSIFCRACGGTGRRHPGGPSSPVNDAPAGNRRFIKNEPSAGEAKRGMPDFGWALDRLREGKRVCRSGWNGKGMWLYLVDYGMFKPHGEEGGAAEGPSESFIAMFTAQRSNVPWLASQTDVLATDWEVAR